MLSRRCVVLFAGGLLCLNGALFAEPEAERERVSKQVWGDPEDNEEAEQGWTWFGMGYENRARASGQPADRRGDAAKGHGTGQGKGKK